MPNDSKSRIALWGAAGAIGTSIATALRTEGIAYRVVGRTHSSLARAFGSDPLAEIVTWNPDDPESVRTAAAGLDAIVYLVGVDYSKFELHPVLMKKTIDGAVAAGVRRLLLIGTVYPYGMAKSAIVTEEHPREPHTFRGKMRKEQEDVLFAAQQAGKIEACELRLPDFYGPGVDKSFLWSAFQAAAKSGRAQLIGPIDRPHQFVFVPDVGPIVVKLTRHNAAWGRAWHFAGSGTITTKALVEKIFAAAGKKPKYIAANKFMLGLFGLFNPLMAGLADMNYLVSTPVLLNDNALVGLLGDIKRTPYDDGIRQTLAAISG